MNARAIRHICYTVAIVCIVAGTILGLAVIWEIVKNPEFTGKVFMTLGLFFVAALLTLSVSRYLGDGNDG